MDFQFCMQEYSSCRSLIKLYLVNYGNGRLQMFVYLDWTRIIANTGGDPKPNPGRIKFASELKKKDISFWRGEDFQGKNVKPFSSVADPGCLSRILIFTHPGSKNINKRKGWKKLVIKFFCSHKFHKIEKYFIFEMLNKKIWANFQRIIEVFTQKIITDLLRIWVWDPRSGIRKKPIPDPGSRVKKAPDPGSATLPFSSFGHKKFWSGFGSYTYLILRYYSSWVLTCVKMLPL